MVVNPRYPLKVEILDGRWRYNGNHEYQGKGSLSLLGVSNRDIGYRYRCAYSFETRGETYEARWVKPHETLEILLSKPGSNPTKPCRLDTRYHP
jgi:hypothetical protein